MENSRTGEICNVDIHKASIQKRLRSKKHFEKIKNEMIIPEWFFEQEQTPSKKKYKKYKTLKH